MYPSRKLKHHPQHCQKAKQTSKRHASRDPAIGRASRSLASRSVPPALTLSAETGETSATSHFDEPFPISHVPELSTAGSPLTAADAATEDATFNAAASHAARSEPPPEGAGQSREAGGMGSFQQGGGQQQDGSMPPGREAAAAALATHTAHAHPRSGEGAAQMGTASSKREMQYILEHFTRLEGRSRRATEEDAAPTGARVHELYAVLTDGEEVPLSAETVRAQEGGCGEVRAKLSNST